LMGSTRPSWAKIHGLRRTRHRRSLSAARRLGAAIGRYVVLERIGAGGMGIVYTAFDPELDRRIAIKLLHPRTHTRTKRPGVARARLIREAQALAQLSHPSVITVHDVGTYHDQVFVAMEFVDGLGMEVVDAVEHGPRC